MEVRAGWLDKWKKRIETLQDVHRDSTNRVWLRGREGSTWRTLRANEWSPFEEETIYQVMEDIPQSVLGSSKLHLCFYREVQRGSKHRTWSDDIIKQCWSLVIVYTHPVCVVLNPPNSSLHSTSFTTHHISSSPSLSLLCFQTLHLTAWSPLDPIYVSTRSSG